MQEKMSLHLRFAFSAGRRSFADRFCWDRFFSCGGNLITSELFEQDG